MHLLYITFGKNIAIHAQAAFSVYSFLAKNEKTNSINIVTDAPEYYDHLKDRVHIILITAEQLKSWKGPFDFFFRAKIKALEKVCALYPGEPVVYLDADTFAYANLNGIASNLATGTAVMHVNEGSFSKGKTKSEQKIWRYAKNKKFGSVEVTSGRLHVERRSYWNAEYKKLSRN